MAATFALFADGVLDGELKVISGSLSCGKSEKQWSGWIGRRRSGSRTIEQAGSDKSIPGGGEKCKGSVPL